MLQLLFVTLGDLLPPVVRPCGRTFFAGLFNTGIVVDGGLGFLSTIASSTIASTIIATPVANPSSGSSGCSSSGLSAVTSSAIASIGPLPSVSGTSTVFRCV